MSLLRFLSLVFEFAIVLAEVVELSLVGEHCVDDARQLVSSHFDGHGGTVLGVVKHSSGSARPSWSRRSLADRRLMFGFGRVNADDGFLIDDASLLLECLMVHVFLLMI